MHVIFTKNELTQIQPQKIDLQFFILLLMIEELTGTVMTTRAMMTRAKMILGVIFTIFIFSIS